MHLPPAASRVPRSELTSTQRWAGRGLVAVLLLSLFLLFWPQPDGPESFRGSDKVVHFALFGALALTSRLRYGASRVALAALVAYAVGSELVQAVALPLRSGSTADLLADVVGVALGWLAGNRQLPTRGR